jgi:hypothetical protein
LARTRSSSGLKSDGPAEGSSFGAKTTDGEKTAADRSQPIENLKLN